MKLSSKFVAAALILCVFVCQHAVAAPFAKTIDFTQPNGQQIELWGEGDEFHAVFETLDGYTVFFDRAEKAYVYAALSADGTELVSTGVMVGQQRPANINPHIRIDQATAAHTASERQKIWEAQTGVRERWESLKKERLAFDQALQYGPTLMAPPSHTTVGEITGIVLLIDFDDAERTVTREEIDNYCNQPGYTGYGNNGSVRDYYQDVSNTNLLYTNVITTYVRIPNSLHPKSYYTDPLRDSGESANELIHDALNILTAQPNYASEIAPMIDQATINVDGQALALNVFYAGGNGGNWRYGLWPHMWRMHASGAYQLTERTAVFTYQITNMGDGLTIGTFCHENGHMICGYPDLYDYEYDSVGGAGKFCLMGSAGSGVNPAQICGYLKYASGWTTTVEVEPYSFVQASVSGVLGTDDFNRVYKVAKPSTAKEYYLFEGRRKKGRDSSLPAEGVLIWHIDELGDRDDQRTKYNDAHENYECSLVQADGLLHFQKNVNNGDAKDAWYLGNTAKLYQNKFNDTTTPSAKWWSGVDSQIRAQDFSAVADVMTFEFVPPKLVLLSKTGALPYGREWAAYNYSVGIVGGVGTITWSVVNGALPEGLTLGENSGVIYGVPAVATNAFFDVVAQTTYNIAVTNSYSIKILPVHTSPFAENFDKISLIEGVPEFWTQEYVTGSLSWGASQRQNDVHPAAAHSPTNFLTLFAADPSNHVTRLVSPRVDFGANPRAGRLSFYHYMEQWIQNTDELRVYYKTAQSGEWELLQTYTSSVKKWTERVIDLPAVSREVYIAFEGTTHAGHGVCVDTVKLWDPTPPYSLVTSDLLPNAVIDQPYQTTIEAEGGYPPYTFTVVSNALPAGITLVNTNGVISGTATTKERVWINIQVMDLHGETQVKTYSLAVIEPHVNLFEENFDRKGEILGWTQEFVERTTRWSVETGGHNGHPSAAHAGNYNARLFGTGVPQADGSYPTHVTRLVSPRINLGQAPDNVTLYFWHCMERNGTDLDTLKVLYRSSLNNPWVELAEFKENTVEWSERSMILPDPSADYYIAFEGYARYGYGICIDSIRITDESLAPVITTEHVLPDGLIGVEYGFQLAALGGIQPYEWTLAEGTLPPGLTLSADGRLSGTPQAECLNEFKVRVAGFDGQSSTNGFKLRIRSVPSVPFFEDFEKGGAMPRAWTQEIVNSDIHRTLWSIATGTAKLPPERKPTTAYSGNYNASLYSNNKQPNAAKTKLITPMLDLGGAVSNAVLTFQHYMEAWLGDQDYLKVYSRTEIDGPWTLLAEYTKNTPSWTERTIALTNVSSTFFIAFESWGQYGYGICIDDVSINGDASDPFGSWLEDNFSSQDIENGVGIGYFDDPDGDGILNIWEYAHLLDPNLYNTSGTPTGGVSNSHLQLIYRQNKSAVDLTFVVEACTDLILGDWSTNGVFEFNRVDQGGWWDVTAQHSVPVTNAPSRFMRLKLLID